MKYDVIIVGAGPGGIYSAYELVKGNSNLKVAVMGCVVNGPGEARECDIGLAGGKDEFLLFEKGVPVRKIPAGCAVDEFVKEVIRVGEERNKTDRTV